MNDIWKIKESLTRTASDMGGSGSHANSSQETGSIIEDPDLLAIIVAGFSIS